MTLSTETGDKNLIIVIDERESSILGDECGDSLVVLSKLDSGTLSDGGVRLLGLDGDFLDDDSSGL